MARALPSAPPLARDPDSLRFTRISVEQGLSQSTVQAIVQDHVGFLWFGTEEGLNRFDGYNFLVFRHDALDPKSLPADMVSALYEDRSRRLWVGTGAGLALLDRHTETFSLVLPTHGVGITAIAESADGTLWVGTEGEGLFERDPATGAFRRHLRQSDDPASLGSNVVSALRFDRDGRLWIGTRDAGVDRLDEAGTRLPRGAPAEVRRFVHHRHDARDPASLSHDEVWGLDVDAAGTLWVATYGRGLSRRDPQTGRFTHYRHSPNDPGSLGIDLLTQPFVDKSGTVWIGTDGTGLQRFDPASGRFLTSAHDRGEPTSLSQNVVRCLYEDVQGQLWVGTYLGGVNVLRRSRHAFRYFTHRARDPAALSNPGVTSFLEDGEGHVWVGMMGGWLDRFDSSTGTFVHHRLPSSAPRGSAILSLHQDRRGRIWAGTYRGGLVRFDPAGKSTVYQHRPGDPRSLGADEVWAITQDERGLLWLGTNAGLDVFDPDLGMVAAHYDTLDPDGLSHGGVRALRRDRQGNLWVGSFGGLYLMARGSTALVRFRHDDRDPQSLGHNGVVALHEDRQGRLWVGTFGGGLSRLDSKTGAFTTYKDFPSNVIYGIQEDSSGRMWLSTNHGLSRFDPSTGQVESFDLTNGLQSLQFYVSASMKTRAGRVLFGSVDGFYDFDPDAILPDTFAPPVVLTGFRIFNEPVRLPTAVSSLSEVTLSPRDKVFSFEFSALDHTFPRRNHYAYLMEGFSEQWIQLRGKREVTFTNLDPGTYRFRVKASNSDGVWIDTASAALRVVVEPPFWRTWWFRGLSGALFALALVAAHRVRVQHLTADITERKRAELALRQAEEKYRGIFENAMEGIFQSTPDGRFLTVNPAFARMLGYASPEEMRAEVTDIGRQLYVDRPRRGEMLRLLEAHGAVQGFECELRRRDGGTLWVSASMRVVRDEAGKPLYFEGATEDIADRHRAKELQESLHRSERMSAMGSLVAGVAHEVRNPLFGISASLDAFEAKAGLETQFAPLIGVMRGEVDRLTALMQGLLDFGKPVHSTPSPEPIGAVLAEAVRSCARLATSRTVRVVNGGANDLPLVLMDRKRLVQVFQNLLQNGIQHSPAGGVVRAEAAKDDGPDGSFVMVSVKDSGPGFLLEDLPRIFEPFFSRRRGGTGLGLSIVQRIVEEHGGTVSVRNRTDGGAAVMVRLPCRPE